MAEAQKGSERQNINQLTPYASSFNQHKCQRPFPGLLMIASIPMSMLGSLCP